MLKVILAIFISASFSACKGMSFEEKLQLAKKVLASDVFFSGVADDCMHEQLDSFISEYKKMNDKERRDSWRLFRKYTDDIVIENSQVKTIKSGVTIRAWLSAVGGMNSTPYHYVKDFRDYVISESTQGPQAVKNQMDYDKSLDALYIEPMIFRDETEFEWYYTSIEANYQLGSQIAHFSSKHDLINQLKQFGFKAGYDSFAPPKNICGDPLKFKEISDYLKAQN